MLVSDSSASADLLEQLRLVPGSPREALPMVTSINPETNIRQWNVDDFVRNVNYSTFLKSFVYYLR